MDYCCFVFSCWEPIAALVFLEFKFLYTRYILYSIFTLITLHRVELKKIWLWYTLIANYVIKVSDNRYLLVINFQKPHFPIPIKELKISQNKFETFLLLVWCIMRACDVTASNPRDPVTNPFMSPAQLRPLLLFLSWKSTRFYSLLSFLSVFWMKTMT